MDRSDSACSGVCHCIPLVALIMRRHQMETFSALLAICAGNSLVTGQWRGTLMFSLTCAWINGWVNNHEAGDLRRHRAHYDVIVMVNDNPPAHQVWGALLRIHIEWPPSSWWLLMSWRHIGARPSATTMLTVLWLLYISWGEVGGQQSDGFILFTVIHVR